MRIDRERSAQTPSPGSLHLMADSFSIGFAQGCCSPADSAQISTGPWKLCPGRLAVRLVHVLALAPAERNIGWMREVDL